MSYENLSTEELVALLKEKDESIATLQNEKKEVEQKFITFVRKIHEEPAALLEDTNLPVYNKSDVSFEDLIIEEDLIDNSKDVAGAERDFIDIINEHNDLINEIYDWRLLCLQKAVEDFTYLVDNNIPCNLEDFNINSYLYYDYSAKPNTNFISILKPLVKQVPVMELFNNFPTSKEQLFFKLFDINKTNELTMIIPFFTDAFSDNPTLNFLKGKNYLERQSIIQSCFPQTINAANIIEKELIKENIKSESPESTVELPKKRI